MLTSIKFYSHILILGRIMSLVSAFLIILLRVFIMNHDSHYFMHATFDTFSFFLLLLLPISHYIIYAVAAAETPSNSASFSKTSEE